MTQQHSNNPAPEPEDHAVSPVQTTHGERSVSPFVRDLVGAKYRKSNHRQSNSGLPPVGAVGSNPLLSPDLAPSLIYLRVSTKDQLNTALDIDPKGLSIATQQAECEGKIVSVGGELVHSPFIEKGLSAKDVDHRPAFKELLAYIKQHPGIKFVVTYNRARAFRNHFDAAIHDAQLAKLGVRLITVKDDFGEGPQAVAMEGMLDVMNGLMNTMNGLDIQTKMAYKATHGGTIGRAPLGYLNTKIKVAADGTASQKEINTVSIDEQRAPLVKKAFELYATGEYTLQRLEATMADLGLTVRPVAVTPPSIPFPIPSCKIC